MSRREYIIGRLIDAIGSLALAMATGFLFGWLL